VTKRYFGCHVSAAGGLEHALINAKKLGVNTIQLHPSPPQRWNMKPFGAGVEDAFNQMRSDSGVEKVFFHGIYLINLATPDKQKLHFAKLSLQNDLDLSARIAGDGVIFHVGSLKDEPDRKAGFARVAEAINWVMSNSKNQARLILEVAAGSGDVIGHKLEELAEIYQMVEAKERVGFGLDSQHMWASGYDFQNDLEKIIEQVDSVLDLKKVWSVHLNDSKTELASKKDRHDNIGQGLIGEKTLKALFLHKKLAQIPFILETPALKSIETAAAEVEKLKGFLG